MGLLKNLSGVRPSRVLRRSAPPRRAFRGPDRREKAQGPRRGTLSRPLRWLGAGLGFLVRALLIAWASLAIYYSNLPWPGLRLALAVAFAGFATWAFWVSRAAAHAGGLGACSSSAWSRGGSPSRPRTIVPGGRKSR